MTIQILSPSDDTLGGGGTFTGDSGFGTIGSGSTSGSTGGTAPGGAPLAIKVLFFRIGFDVEVMPIGRWSYQGPFARAELQATVFDDTGIFHPVPDGLMNLEIAEGESVRWAESTDPAELVDSLDVSTAIEDLHQGVVGTRVTRKVIDPFKAYLRAIIIGPGSGIQTRIRSMGDYDHPPATLTAGQFIVVTK